METQVTSWLNEGLRHYSSGDAARALEAWYRILEVEPEHPAALEYVAFVRDSFRADGSAVAVEPAAAVDAAAPLAVEMPMLVTTRRADTVDGFSWADLVGADANVVAPAPVEVAAVVEAAAVVEVAAVVEAAVVEDEDDGGVDVSFADDEPAGLPSMIIAQDIDEPTVADAAVLPTLVAPASLLPSLAGDDEVMPAPDAVSPARVIPRSLTPLSQSAPPLSVDFDALVSSKPAVAEPAVPGAAFGISAVVLDPPVIDIPRSPTPLALTTSISSPPLAERVIRQSIRFDEPRAPARGASANEGSGPVPVGVAAPRTSTPAASSPWDDVNGPAQPLDLDVSTRPPSSFDTLLRAATSSTAPTAAAVDIVEDMTRSMAVATVRVPIDENESLMTGARELFDLGDFSGSLELVEKVLRSNGQHEGALAYLKRNETTLLRMYESKIGDMARVPRPLVPPDEVIWMNMHHRAGFILSQIDGTLSYEDLLEVSGMDRFDTVRIVADLVTAGIIG